MILEKKCAKCHTPKSWDDFNKRPNKTPVAYCRSCQLAMDRERKYGKVDHVFFQHDKKLATI